MITGLSTKGCLSSCSGSQISEQDRKRNQERKEFTPTKFLETHPFSECLTAFMNNNYAKISADHVEGPFCVPSDTNKECLATCNGHYATQCLSIDWEYYCNGGFKLKYSCGGDEKIILHRQNDYEKLCDGYFDCVNKGDEKNCSNRFYCLNGYESVHKSKVCDSVPDCSDVSDECQGCQREGISTDKEFIGSFFLRWFTLFQCVSILVLNGKAVIEHVASKKKTKIGKIDRVLCICLTFYDLIMGAYLIIIVVHSMTYRNSYCIQDLVWRSSFACKTTGILFSISTQGSLLTAMMMSVTRCYTCL